MTVYSNIDVFGGEISYARQGIPTGNFTLKKDASEVSPDDIIKILYNYRKNLLEGTDGSKTISTSTFTSATGDFVNDGVNKGDYLYITEGSEQGSYKITLVTATVLTVDFTWANTESALDFWVQKRRIVVSGINGVTTISTDNFTSTGATFQADGIVPGDMLIIKGSGSDAGSYIVATVDSETQLSLNDHAGSPVSFSGDTGLSYDVGIIIFDSLIEDVDIYDAQGISAIDKSQELFQARPILNNYGYNDVRLARILYDFSQYSYITPTNDSSAIIRPVSDDTVGAYWDDINGNNNGEMWDDVDEVPPLDGNSIFCNLVNDELILNMDSYTLPSDKHYEVYKVTVTVRAGSFILPGSLNVWVWDGSFWSEPQSMPFGDAWTEESKDYVVSISEDSNDMKVKLAFTTINLTIAIEYIYFTVYWRHYDSGDRIEEGSTITALELNTESTIMNTANLAALQELKTWYLGVDRNLYFNDGDRVSGLTFTTSTKLDNINGKRQIKSYDRVVLYGGYVGGGRITAGAGSGNIIAKETYNLIKDQTVLNNLAAQLLTEKGYNKYNVDLEWYDSEKFLLQVAETITINSGIRFSKSSRTIPANDYVIDKATLLLGEDCEYLGMSLDLIDFLVFSLQEESEVNEVDKSTQENATAIDQVQTESITGAGAGEVNTGANVGADGVGVFEAKSGVTLQFKHIAPASSKITVVENGSDIDIDVALAEIIAGIEAVGLTIASGQKIVFAGLTPAESLEIYDGGAADGGKYIQQLQDGILHIHGYHRINLGTNEGGYANKLLIYPTVIEMYETLDMVGNVITSSDADLTFNFGRASLGSPGADYMYLAHRDFLTTTDYAVRQSNAGQTFINSVLGSTVLLGINSVTKMSLSGATLTMSVPIDMQENLLRLGNSGVADPIELLHFKTERAWSFRKRGVGASSYLSLESDVGEKTFRIGYDDGVIWNTKFLVSATQANCYADFYKLRVNTGSVIIDEIINNDALSTSDVKLCTVGNVKAYADALISNNVFDVNWNGVTDVGASKDALYDVISPLAAGVTYAGTWNPTSPDGLFPNNLESDTNGSTAGTSVFTSVGKDFGVAGVQIGDILLIEDNDGGDAGYHVITTVGTTTVTCSGSTFGTASNLIYQVFTVPSGGDYYITTADGECYDQFYENGDWIIWNETTIAWDRIRSYKGDNWISIKPGDSIQTAIDEIEAVGSGTVFIEPGTHNISSALTVNNANVDITIIGAGEASKIVQTSTSQHGLRIVACDKCILEKFAIDFSAATTNWTYGLYIDDDNVYAKNLYIEGPATPFPNWYEVYYCIYVDPATAVSKVLIQNCYCYKGSGILAAGATDTIVDGNWVDTPHPYGIGSSAEYSIITNNVIFNLTYASSNQELNGIRVTAANNVIMGNVIRNVENSSTEVGIGIMLRAKGTCEGNVIYECDKGIQVYPGTSDLSIVGNNIENSNIAGISIEEKTAVSNHTYNITIAGNSISGGTGYGIYFEDPGTTYLISQVNVSGNTIADLTTPRAIYANKTGSLELQGLNITGNIIYNCVGDIAAHCGAIEFSGVVTDSIISSNIIRDCSNSNASYTCYAIYLGSSVVDILLGPNILEGNESDTISDNGTDTRFVVEKIIDSATSLANAFQVGDATDKMKFFTASNISWIITENANHIYIDSDARMDIRADESIDLYPSAATVDYLRLTVVSGNPVLTAGGGGELKGADNRVDSTPATIGLVKVGTYTGDGATAKFITTGFRPKFIYIYTTAAADSGTINAIFWNQLSTGDRVHEIYGDDLHDNRIFGDTTNGFYVDDDGADQDPNASGRTYCYLAIG